MFIPPTKLTQVDPLSYKQKLRIKFGDESSRCDKPNYKQTPAIHTICLLANSHKKLYMSSNFMPRLLCIHSFFEKKKQMRHLDATETRQKREV